MATQQTTDYYSLYNRPNNLASYEANAKETEKALAHNYAVLNQEAANAFTRNKKLYLETLPAFIPSLRKDKEFFEEWNESRKLVESYFGENAEASIIDDENMDQLEAESSQAYGKLLGESVKEGATELDIEKISNMSGIDKRTGVKKEIGSALNNLPLYMEQSADDFSIPYNGRLITLNQAKASGDPKVYTDVKKALHINYTRQLVKAGYSKRQIRKHFIRPLIQKDREETSLWLKQQEGIAGEINKKRRGDELHEMIISDPERGLTNWIEKYFGYHGNSRPLAKQEAAQHLISALETGVLTPHNILGIVDKEFKAHDKSIQTPGKYFKEFAGLRAKAQQMISKQLDADIAEFKKKEKEIYLSRLEDIKKNGPPSKEKVLQWAKDDRENSPEGLISPLVKKHLDAYEEGEETTSQMNIKEIERRLTLKWQDGSLTEEDVLRETSLSADDQKKWLKRVEGKYTELQRGLLPTLIDGYVNELFDRTKTDTTKTGMWVHNKEKATLAFHETFLEAWDNSAGQLTQEQIWDNTKVDINKNVQAGKYNHLEKVTPDIAELKKYSDVKQLIKNDTAAGSYETINKTEPWAGEEKVIQSSIDYFLNPNRLPRPTGIAALYYEPLLKHLPKKFSNDEDADYITLTSLMEHRLKKLGHLDKINNKLNSKNKHSYAVVKSDSPTSIYRYLLEEGTDLDSINNKFNIEPLLDDTDREDLGSYFTKYNSPETLNLPLLRYMSEELQPTQ